MNNKSQSILICTNQAWKYRTSLALGVFVVALFVFMVSYFPYGGREIKVCLSVGFFLSAVSIVLNLSIKCPKCNAKWYWLVMKSPVGKKGLGELHKLGKCPTCGFSCDVGT